jgi:NDP-sugar pyrophosphorylase family protein
MTPVEFPVAILAGGLATRLRPLTETIPKALIGVNGEPFVAHQLRLLRAKRVQRVVLCVGYLGEMIQDFVGNGERFGIHVDFSFDGPVLLGTAGAIKKTLPLLNGTFFVLYGDSYLPCDYQEVAEAFQQSGKEALMTVFRNDGRWDSSNVEYSEGRILTYHKQNRNPRMRHIDYGLGIFRPSAFATVPEQEPWDLAALYQELLSHRQLAALEVQERFYEIGSPEGLEETARYLRQHSPPESL